MRKLLTFLVVSTLALFLVPLVFAAGPIVKNVDRDFNAFASGTLADGGSIDISVDKDLPPGNAPDEVSLNVFAFSPSFPEPVFAFASTELSPAEFQFDISKLSSARLNTTLPATTFSGGTTNIAVDITWTAVGDLLHRETSDKAVQGNNVFNFSSNSTSRFATISGTTDSAICCTFSDGQLSKDARQSIQVIHP